MPPPPPPSPSCTPTGSTSAPACWRHHREAGNFEAALGFHRRAADAALRIYAQEEALEHLDGALARARRWDAGR